MTETGTSRAHGISRWRPAALAFAMVFPTAATIVYFFWLREAYPAIQLTGYSIVKLIQFGFPLAWLLVDRDFFGHWQTVEGGRPRRYGLGILFGVMVVVLIFSFYYGVLASTDTAHQLASQLSAKLAGAGIDSLWKFFAMILFYSLVHSFLEEYYWRWFVYRGWLRYCGVATAVFVSSIGFMAHHTFILSVYFGWDSVLCWLFSLGVAIGGAIWALVYQWSRSLFSPWISHLIIDAGIFSLSFLLVKDRLQ